MIVKNYTGDRLSFGIATEQARGEGFNVDMVVVGDDCALPRSASIAGRRGLVGTLLVHKLAGAKAATGAGLDAVVEVARYAAENIGTMGVSLSPCVVPGRPPSFTLPEGHMELGEYRKIT